MPAEARLFVSRNEERPGFGNPRPRRHLHDGDDRAGAGAGAHLAQPVAQARLQLVPYRLDELELLADRLGELDRRYFDLVLESGRNACVFRDEEAGCWFSQRA